MMMLDTVSHMARKEYNSNTTNVDLFADMVSAGLLTNLGHGEIAVAVVASGVTLDATSTATPAFTIGAASLRQSAILVNAGSIRGKGGAGGAAGGWGWPPGHGGGGGAGGTAVKTTGVPLKIDNTGGSIEGGTGGQGGTGASTVNTGKGCGVDHPGSVGSTGATGGGATGASGSNGTDGGCGFGNAGGGGAAGKYIEGSAYTTWLVNGTRLGGTS